MAGEVRVTIVKDGDAVVWEGHAALVVVLREERGQPLPLVSIRGGNETDLIFALAYLMAAVETQVHPGATETAMSVKDDLAAMPAMKREPRRLAGW